ncbi:hypothetical protein EUX98_g3711 [Antrodiella citrinella]|uniref:Uncharacterized protein n=1 Tax=Antrodiella citrinella TaxID=2447956 RepID=A0A4S4MXY6_9APHY|nr:hypothetical protein EUX98_g3711 [Antrodiella citrinella]
MAPSSSSGVKKLKNEDDGASWKYSEAVSKLREVQSIIRTPNLNDPGYARQKANGKFWVRERLDALFDARSWVEIGSNEKTGGEIKEFIPG